MNSQSQPIKSRGLLHQTVSLEQFTLHRILPDEALGDMIENYWIIEWDRPGKPDYIQQNIPHPSQNLVIDPQGQSGLFGIITERFSYTITQKGALFGCKFWPGAMRAFSETPMNKLTDRCVPISDHFALEDKILIKLFAQTSDKQAFAQTFDEMLKEQQLVTAIDTHSEILTVADLADFAKLSPRSLQRLFRDYVGVSPTWTIQRYRIIDAVDTINKGEEVNLTTLAQNLGFYDSAHFSKSFKALIGTSPNAYRASIS